MTEFKQRQLERERLKALGELLVLECKNPKASIDSIRAILDNGADINYRNSYPLHWACRRKNFPLIKFMIANGALNNCDVARMHISKICESGFNDKMEGEFFGILDLVHSKTGDYMSLFTPYINIMAVSGNLEKIKSLIKRYYLTESEVVEAVELRVIFDIVTSEKLEMLTFIEKHRQWIDQKSFDRAVDSDELIVLCYMLENFGYIKPSVASISKAVFDGHFEVLDLLISQGYSFEKNPLFLEKAARASFDRGTGSLEYLLVNGYSLDSSYKGRSILEHANLDKNITLINFIEERRLINV